MDYPKLADVLPVCSLYRIPNGTDMIEIKAINVLNVSNRSDPDYETNLPVGNYRVVASSIGYNTVSDNFTLTNAGISLPDLVFTATVP